MSQVETPTQFFFTAIGRDGARKRGLRVARDESTLAEALSDDGLLLLHSRRLPQWTAGAANMPLKDQAAFNDQLHTLLARGVPLIEALEVAGSVVSSQTKDRIERIRGLVQSGASFSDACEQAGGFDKINIMVYRAAERAGDLAEAAARLAITANRRRAIASKAITLLIYPAIVTSVSSIIAILVLVVVVPTIGKALRDQGQELPWFTEVVVSLGEGLRDYGLWLLLVFGALVTGAVLARKFVAALGLTVLGKLPAISKLRLVMESARFFSVMAAMTKSGVPLADALGVSTGAVSHTTLREQLETMRRRLIEGALLRTLIEQVTALPLATRRLLIAAERSGDLDAAFDGLAEDLAIDADNRSERLLAFLEPALILIMFVLIGTILFSIMLPIISITKNVG